MKEPTIDEAIWVCKTANEFILASDHPDMSMKAINDLCIKALKEMKQSQNPKEIHPRTLD